MISKGITISKLVNEAAMIFFISAIIGVFYNTISEKGIWWIGIDIKSVERVEGEVFAEDAYHAWQNRALFVDVRSEHTYQEGHIKNAISLPYSSFDKNIQEWLPELKSYPQVILYCNEHCNLSKVTYKKLKIFGLNNMTYLKGGFQGWVSKGFPVE